MQWTGENFAKGHYANDSNEEQKLLSDKSETH